MAQERAQPQVIETDRDVHSALANVASYFGASHVVIAKIFPDDRRQVIEEVGSSEISLGATEIETIRALLGGNKQLSVSDTRNSSDLDAASAEVFRRLNVLSFAAAKIRLKSMSWNFLFAVLLPRERSWTDAEMRFLSEVSGKISNAIEKRDFEEKLTQSERQLRKVTENIRALIGYVDANQVIRFANAMYEEWFDAPPHTIVGKKLEDLIGPEAYSTIKPKVAEALAGQFVEFETRVRYTNGTRYVHASYVPDIAPNGEILGFYSLVSDITQLKESEQLLRSAEHRFQVITESFTDYAILSMDVDGKIDSWNSGAENVFGWKRSEILGRSGEALFTPEDVMRGAPEKEMMIARKNGRAADERWHIRKDGSRFYASGVLTPLVIDGDLVGYAKIAMDRTDIKRNAELLQQAHDEMEMRVLERTRELADTSQALVNETTDRLNAEKQRGNLLRRLITSQEDERRRIARDIHDQLGQRVTGLRLKIASLMEAVRSQPDIAERVEPIQSIAEALDSEVSFLAWELRPTVLDELGLVEAIETFVANWSGHYGIQAIFHSTQMSDLRLPSDVETHLYRITQEALNNIVKHAEASHVSILMERPDFENIVFIIEDDGVGFDKSKACPIRESGRGLGLAGMRERAELIGATLEIETEEARGTTIYITLPITHRKDDLSD